MHSRGGENLQQGSSWQTRGGSDWWSGQSHMCEQINWEEQLGSETDCTTQGSSSRKECLLISHGKNLWGLRWWEKLPASQERSLERPTGAWSVHKPTHSGNQHQRGPI